MSPYKVTLDPATTYQTIDGFGPAITGAACYNLLKMLCRKTAPPFSENVSTL